MNKQPSTTERANLLVATGLVSVLSLTDILVILLHPVFDPPRTKISFGISDPGPDPFILGHVLTIGLIVMAFLATRRYVGVFLWCMLCLSLFIFELAKSYHIVYHTDLIYTNTFLGLLGLIGNPIDFLVPILLLPICLWLLSLTIRPLIRMHQASND
jgi:hypothetical protein